MEQQLIPYVATTHFGDGRMLVLAPHPDDEIFGCGGAILRHILEGHAVRVDILTDGAYQRSPEYAAARRLESQQAAHALGYGEPTFWGLGDRTLEYGENLIQRIVDAMVAFGASQVFAPSIYEMHPDHRALGIAAIEAARRSLTPLDLVMYEVGVPMLRPTVLLDISDLMDRKRQAMACFASQLEQQAYDTQISALNCFRSYTLGPNVTAAEAYRIVPQAQLHSLPLELFESEYQRQRSMGLPMTPEDLPLVSVIILQGDSPFVTHALDSIAIQTYPHVEVLLPFQDGHAPPTRSESCGRYPLRFVTQVGAQTPQALANMGLDNARGRYVSVLDAQDALLPDHLVRLVRALSSGTARAAYTGVRWTTNDGQERRIENTAFLADRLRASNSHPNCAYLFERTLVQEGCHFPDGPWDESTWAFWLLIADRTTLLHIPHVSAISVSRKTSDRGGAADDSKDTAESLRASRFRAFTPQQWSRTLNALEQAAAQSAELAHDARSECERLTDALTDLQRRNAALELQQAEALRERDQLAIRVSEWQAQCAQWEHSAEVNAQQVQNLQVSVQAYATSTSWRMSAPIRWASRLLRRNLR